MLIAAPYIFLVVFLFIQGYSERVRQLGRLPVKITNYFILILFFCFRGYIFTDVLNYHAYFLHVKTLDEIFADPAYLRWQWWEPGFVLYMSFFKTICDNYFFYQFFDSLIDLILLYKSLEYFRENDSFSLMIFLTMNGMIIFFDLQRNVKSILLFFYALRYIESRNWIKYVLCCLIGFFFHTVSFVYFFVYPFTKIRISAKSFCLFSFFCIVLAGLSAKILNFGLFLISFLSVGRLADLFAGYVTDDAVAGFLSLGTLEKLIMIFFLTLNFKKITADKKNVLFVKIYMLYLFCYFSFFSIRVISERMSILFVFSYWILVPELIKVQKKEYRIFFSLFVLIYCVLKMSLYSQPQDWYENWLFGSISTLEERRRILLNFTSN